MNINIINDFPIYFYMNDLCLLFCNINCNCITFQREANKWMSSKQARSRKLENAVIVDFHALKSISGTKKDGSAFTSLKFLVSLVRFQFRPNFLDI